MLSLKAGGSGLNLTAASHVTSHGDESEWLTSKPRIDPKLRARLAAPARQRDTPSPYHAQLPSLIFAAAFACVARAETTQWIRVSDGSGVHPSGGEAPVMIFDPVSGRPVLFGGQDNDNNRNDETWAWLASSRTWSRIVVAGSSPDARSYAAFAYDAPGARGVLFGGTGVFFDLLDDTWIWSDANTSWTYHSRMGRRS